MTTQVASYIIADLAAAPPLYVLEAIVDVLNYSAWTFYNGSVRIKTVFGGSLEGGDQSFSDFFVLFKNCHPD